MELAAAHRHARTGYWLGMPYWNYGYCTEAVKAVHAYGFPQQQLHRFNALHFFNNPASGGVPQKAGMTYEGRMREHHLRFDQCVDVEFYGMLKEDFDRR